SRGGPRWRRGRWAGGSVRLIRLMSRKAAGKLLLAVLCGVLAGASGSAVLALVNEHMDALGQPDRPAAWTFAALAFAAVVTRAAAKLLLVRVSTRLVRDMRV